MIPVLLAGVAVAVSPYAARDIPKAIHVREVVPAEDKVGDIVKAYGDALSADRVVEVYLSDDFMNYRVEVLEQTDHWLTFSIPAGIPAGKFRVAVVGSESPVLLEEPVFVGVIEGQGTSYGRVAVTKSLMLYAAGQTSTG